MTDLNEIQIKLYDEEYVPNGYKAMWENQEEKLGELGALFSLQWEVARISSIMERIRDGDVPEDISQRDKWMIENLSKKNFHKISQIAELMLIITEINEAINAVLCGEDPSEEYADIIIRASNAMMRNTGSNLEETILAKHKKNVERGELHGRRAI